MVERAPAAAVKATVAAVRAAAATEMEVVEMARVDTAMAAAATGWVEATATVEAATAAGVMGEASTVRAGCQCSCRSTRR